MKNTFLQTDRKLKSHFLTILILAFAGLFYTPGFAQEFMDDVSHDVPDFLGTEGVDGDLFIENCYQKIKMDGGEYRLLRDGFSFSRTSTTIEGNWLWFRAYHNEDGEVNVGPDKYFGQWTEGIALPLPSWIRQVDEVIQVNDTTTVLNPFFDVYVADMYDDEKGFAKDFIFGLLDLYPAIVKLEITVVSYNETLERFLFGESNTTTFHIVEKDKILDTEIGTDQGCLTFDHFQMNGGVNLDGLCGKVRNELALPSNGIDPPEVVSDEFEFGNHVTFDYLGDHCEECLEMAAEAYPINESPISCGCRDFVLKTTIQPCYGKEHICEPLIIYEDVQVCCRCDIRDFQGPLN